MAQAPPASAEKPSVKPKLELLEGQDVQLTVLGEKGWSGFGRFVRIEAQSVTVECESAVRSGTALRLDTGGALLLGECSRCEVHGLRFEVHIRLEQVIPSMSDLAKLVSAICGATPRQPIQYAPSEAVEAHVQRCEYGDKR